MLNTGAAKNEGKILWPDLTLHPLYLSCHIFQLEIIGLVSDMVSAGTFKIFYLFLFLYLQLHKEEKEAEVLVTT